MNKFIPREKLFEKGKAEIKRIADAKAGTG